MTVQWLYFPLEQNGEPGSLSQNVTGYNLVDYGTGSPYSNGYWRGNGVDRASAIYSDEVTGRPELPSLIYPHAGRIVVAFEVSPGSPTGGDDVFAMGDRAPAGGARNQLRISYFNNDRFQARTYLNGVQAHTGIGPTGGNQPYKNMTDFHAAYGYTAFFADWNFLSRRLGVHVFGSGATPLKQTASAVMSGDYLGRARTLNLESMMIGANPLVGPAKGPGENIAGPTFGIRRLHIINFGDQQIVDAPTRTGIPDNMSELFDLMAREQMILSQAQLAMVGLGSPTKRVRIRRYRIKLGSTAR